ncbi:MAG: DUF2314 domain-containing protein [Pseudomonadota bacterium]
MTYFKRPLFMILIGGALYFASLVIPKEGDQVVVYEGTDLTMNEAQDEALRSLPDFLAHKLDADSAMLKVAFPVSNAQGNGFEVIWVGAVQRDGESFAGNLANAPVDIDANLGDIVEFSQDMIRDWTYRGGDGKLYGNYTTRVMLSSLAKDQADQIAAALSASPLPTAW